MLFDGKVLRNERLNEEIFLLEIEKPEGFSSLPGQFVHLKVKDQAYPLLRRPISIYKEGKESFTLLIKKVGKVSLQLSEAKPGLVLDILGPLGNSFPIERDKPILLVGGGIGVAPVSFLASSLKEEGMNYEAYLGFREEPYAQEDFLYPVIHSEKRDAGFITGPIEERLKKGDAPLIYACGPTPLLKAVKRLAESYGSKAYLSLEEHMACGIGACVGCTVKTTRNEDFVYKKVCKDGPVFLAEEVLWDE